MNALPMLDHIMLWVARGVVLYVVIASFFSCASFGPHPGQFHIDISESLFLIEGVLWIMCLWHPLSTIVRLYLGLSSGFFFALASFSVLKILLLFPHLNVSYVFHYILIPLVGFGSMLWVSIRPPSIFKTSDPHSHENHPLPQSC
jgi:hypothetical protein